MIEYVTVPCIALICWFIGYCIKTLGQKDSVDRLIPCIVGFIGGVLGVVIFHFNPELIPANDIWNAICIGIASGFAATGIDQIYKQLIKKK